MLRHLAAAPLHGWEPVIRVSAEVMGNGEPDKGVSAGPLDLTEVTLGDRAVHVDAHRLPDDPCR